MRLPRLAVSLALALMIINCSGTSSAGDRFAKQPLAIAAPLNSGVCGICGDGQCPSPIAPYRCVRLFDRGALIQTLTCDQAGHFRAELAPGQYALDRTLSGYPLKNVRGAETFEVRSGRWTRLEGLTMAQCPDSGIYGWDYRPCSGAKLSGSYTCVSALDSRTGRTVAAASCEKESPAFSLPLPPGRYLVKSTHWPEQTVDIQPGRWTRLGLTEARPCPPLP